MSEVALQTFTFASQADGAPIFARKWAPPGAASPRGLVQITHGVAEHSGRYDRFARVLAGAGYVVYALDLRAHGQTAPAGTLGVAGPDAWRLMTSDIRQLGQRAKADNPGLPLVAFGHSMGSALTQFYIQNYADQLAGAMLCGTMGSFPGLSVKQVEEAIAAMRAAAEGPQADAVSPFMMQMLGEFNAPFVRGDAPNGAEWQTQDVEEQRKFLSDPLSGKPFSNALTYAVVSGFHALWSEKAEAGVPNALPLLVICGTDDPVGGYAATVRQLIQRYCAKGQMALAYKFYPGARHEILNDPCRDEVHRDVLAWLGPLTAG